MYDIIFLSYDEPNAEENWELLKTRFPLAKRVDGVSPIVAAHKKAVHEAKTNYFWVVDADNIVADDFTFNFVWDKKDRINDRVAVWRAKNSINGLEYGYGGIKLLPRNAVLDVKDDVVDFTTSISENFHVMDTVASTTVIHTTPLTAWRSGYREAVKLCSKIIRGSDPEESESRLSVWCTNSGEHPNGRYCVIGAKVGVFDAEYDLEETLKNINNWNWLRQEFEYVFNSNDRSIWR